MAKRLLTWLVGSRSEAVLKKTDPRHLVEIPRPPCIHIPFWRFSTQHRPARDPRYTSTEYVVDLKAYSAAVHFVSASIEMDVIARTFLDTDQRAPQRMHERASLMQIAHLYPVDRSCQHQCARPYWSSPCRTFHPGTPRSPSILTEVLEGAGHLWDVGRCLCMGPLRAWSSRRGRIEHVRGESRRRRMRSKW